MINICWDVDTIIFMVFKTCSIFKSNNTIALRDYKELINAFMIMSIKDTIWRKISLGHCLHL